MTDADHSAMPADADDARARLAGARSLKFGFRYLDKPFRATVTQAEGVARLALHGHLGTLPFTAQSAEARANILRLLKGAGRGCLELGPQQDVLMHGKCELALPLTVSGILAGAVEILIESRDRLAPVVEQLELAEIAAAAAAAAAAEVDTNSPEAAASPEV